VTPTFPVLGATGATIVDAVGVEVPVTEAGLDGTGGGATRPPSCP
jgi:hypothetical protein